MKKKIVIFLLALIIPTINVEGFYCKYSDIAKYKGLASNISTYYDYEETGNNISFSVTLTNLNENLYIVDTTNNKYYYYKSNELTISGYKPGQTIKYNVYTTDSNCSEKLLYTIRIILPDYNPYYKDNVCNEVNNYIFCQKWYKHDLDYNSFVKKVVQYKESLKNEPVIEQPNIEDEYGLFQIFIDIWIDYYHVFLISIIAICGVVIYVTNKKSNIYK